MLVVTRIDAITRHKAVDHQIHISALAARPPRERLCGVKQKTLGEKTCQGYTGRNRPTLFRLGSVNITTYLKVQYNRLNKEKYN